MLDNHFEVTKTQELKTIENPSIKCYGSEFCDGKMTRADVYDATNFAFHAIRCFDPALFANFSRENLHLFFIKGKEETIYFPIDKINITQEEKRIANREASQNLEGCLKDVPCEDVLPIKVCIVDGDDAQSRTTFYQRGNKIISLGCAIIVSDAMFQAMPAEFKSDPTLKKAYEYACMTTLLVHEGYHLEQPDLIEANKEIAKSDYIKSIPPRAAVEIEVLKKEISFLENASRVWSLEDNIFRGYISRAIEHILVRERELLTHFEKFFDEKKESKELNSNNQASQRDDGECHQTGFKYSYTPPKLMI